MLLDIPVNAQARASALKPNCNSASCIFMLETPVFKILAPNDTGSSPGHQGGIVIPKDIEQARKAVTTRKL